MHFVHATIEAPECFSGFMLVLFEVIFIICLYYTKSYEKQKNLNVYG